MCNFTPAVAGKPALLTHDELTTARKQISAGTYNEKANLGLER